MPKPEHANCAAELEGVIRVYDVVDLLPRAAAPETRQLSEVKYLGLHHSGFLGRPGFSGVLASAQFAIKPAPPEGTGRGFRTFPYHLWIPHEPEFDHNAYHVVYQGLRWTEVGSHIGMMNVPSAGLALQGNLTKRPLSEFQKFCLPRVLRWAPVVLPALEIEVMHKDADKHGGHRKATCPGLAAAEFISGLRYC